MMRDDVCIFFAMKCKQMVHAAVRWKLGTTLLGAASFEDIFLARPFDFLNMRSIFLKLRGESDLRRNAGPGALLWNYAMLCSKTWAFWLRSCRKRAGMSHFEKPRSTILMRFAQKTLDQARRTSEPTNHALSFLVREIAT